MPTILNQRITAPQDPVQGLPRPAFPTVSDQPVAVSQYIPSKPAVDMSEEREYETLMREKEALLSELKKICHQKDSIIKLNQILIEKMRTFGQSRSH